jgi:hypothetical protein
VAAAAGVTEPSASFTCWFWDYDNDGWLDLLVSGYLIRNAGDIAADYLGVETPAERARLYHNQHDGTFADVTKAAGLFKVLHTMGANFGDLDNDGWLDFYVGTGDPELGTLIPNRMFRNDGGKRFQDVTTPGGFGQLQKGHGLALAMSTTMGRRISMPWSAAPFPAIIITTNCSRIPVTAITGSSSGSKACNPTGPPSVRASRSSPRPAWANASFTALSPAAAVLARRRCVRKSA